MITSQTHRIIDANYCIWSLKLGRTENGWLYEVYYEPMDLLVAYGYIETDIISHKDANRILETTIRLYNKAPMQPSHPAEIEDSPRKESGPHKYKPLSLSELKLLLPHFHQECKSRRPKAGSPRTCPKCNGSGSPDIHQNNAKIASAELAVTRGDGSETVISISDPETRVFPELEDVAQESWDEQLKKAEAEKEENQKPNRTALPPAEKNTHPKPGTPRQIIELDWIRKRLRHKLGWVFGPDHIDDELNKAEVSTKPIEASEHLVSPMFLHDAKSTNKKYIITEAGYTMSNHMGDVHPQQELFAVTAHKSGNEESQGTYGIEAEFARQASPDDWKLIRLVAAAHFDEVI